MKTYIFSLIILVIAILLASTMFLPAQLHSLQTVQSTGMFRINETGKHRNTWATFTATSAESGNWQSSSEGLIFGTDVYANNVGRIGIFGQIDDGKMKPADSLTWLGNNSQFGLYSEITMWSGSQMTFDMAFGSQRYFTLFSEDLNGTNFDTRLQFSHNFGLTERFSIRPLAGIQYFNNEATYGEFPLVKASQFLGTIGLESDWLAGQVFSIRTGIIYDFSIAKKQHAPLSMSSSRQQESLLSLQAGMNWKFNRWQWYVGYSGEVNANAHTLIAGGAFRW